MSPARRRLARSRRCRRQPDDAGFDGTGERLHLASPKRATHADFGRARRDLGARAVVLTRHRSRNPKAATRNARSLLTNSYSASTHTSRVHVGIPRQAPELRCCSGFVEVVGEPRASDRNQIGSGALRLEEPAYPCWRSSPASYACVLSAHVRRRLRMNVCPSSPLTVALL